jgi:hypothetical protein
VNPTLALQLPLIGVESPWEANKRLSPANLLVMLRRCRCSELSARRPAARAMKRWKTPGVWIFTPAQDLNTFTHRADLRGL